MCKDCNDTGKIQLFTSVVECDCHDDYIDAIGEVDVKWSDSCCSCHLHPPCGFCTRYADASLDEPEYCDICGDPSPSEGPQLCGCRE